MWDSGGRNGPSSVPDVTKQLPTPAHSTTTGSTVKLAEPWLDLELNPISTSTTKGPAKMTEPEKGPEGPPPPGTLIGHVQKSRGRIPPRPKPEVPEWQLQRADETREEWKCRMFAHHYGVGVIDVNSHPRITEANMGGEIKEHLEHLTVAPEDIEIWPPPTPERTLGDWLRWLRLRRRNGRSRG